MMPVVEHIFEKLVENTSADDGELLIVMRYNM